MASEPCAWQESSPYPFSVEDDASLLQPLCASQQSIFSLSPLLHFRPCVFALRTLYLYCLKKELSLVSLPGVSGHCHWLCLCNPRSGGEKMRQREKWGGVEGCGLGGVEGNQWPVDKIDKLSPPRKNSE